MCAWKSPYTLRLEQFPTVYMAASLFFVLVSHVLRLFCHLRPFTLSSAFVAAREKNLFSQKGRRISGAARFNRWILCFGGCCWPIAAIGHVQRSHASCKHAGGRARPGVPKSIYRNTQNLPFFRQIDELSSKNTAKICSECCSKSSIAPYFFTFHKAFNTIEWKEEWNFLELFLIGRCERRCDRWVYACEQPSNDFGRSLSFVCLKIISRAPENVVQTDPTRTSDENKSNQNFLKYTARSDVLMIAA